MDSRCPGPGGSTGRGHGGRAPESADRTRRSPRPPHHESGENGSRGNRGHAEETEQGTAGVVHRTGATALGHRPGLCALHGGGTVAGWLVGLLADWLATLPLLSVQDWPGSWAHRPRRCCPPSARRPGAVFEPMAHREQLGISLSGRRVVLESRGRRQEFPREDVAMAFRDGQELVLLGHDGGELTRRNRDLEGENVGPPSPPTATLGRTPTRTRTTSAAGPRTRRACPRGRTPYPRPARRCWRRTRPPSATCGAARGAGTSRRRGEGREGPPVLEDARAGEPGPGVKT